MTLPIFAQVKRRLADKIPDPDKLKDWLQAELYPMLRQLREDFNGVVGNATLGTGFNGGAFPFGGVTVRVTRGAPVITTDPVGSIAFDITTPSTNQFYRFENPGPVWVSYNMSGISLTNDLGGTPAAPTVVQLTGLAGIVSVLASTLLWKKTVTSPAVTHEAQTTDAATSDLTITSQAPVAGAAVNLNPGNIVYKVPSPAAGGTAGKHSFFVSGTERASIGFDSLGFIAFGANSAGTGNARFPNNSGFYGRNVGNTADVIMLQLNTSDAINVGDGANGAGINMNAKTGATIQMSIAGTGYFSTTGVLSRFTTVNTGDVAAFQNSGISALALVQLTGTQRILALFAGNGFSTTQMPANTGDLVAFIAAAATAPTANPVGGMILYIDPADGKLKARGTAGTITVIAIP